MWNFLTQPGLSTTVLDFTTDLSLLGISLVGLMALAAGSIVCIALRHSITQQATRAAEGAPKTHYREAA
jgi:hypothetical protein